jgi:hypothetical protein
MLKNVVRSLVQGIALLPVVVLGAIAVALILGVLLGSVLGVSLVFWSAVVDGPGAMIFALLCAGPICMAALWGWIAGSGWPGAELIREDVKQETVWDVTTGSPIVTPPDGGWLGMILLTTIVLEFIAYAALQAAFDLPKISGGSPFYLAASLVVAFGVKYAVEAVAARRRTFRTERGLAGWR